MVKYPKVVVSSVLALSLALSSAPAFAVSFDDTVGSAGEVSISKLVSLGYMVNKGTSFNPESALTRAELTEISNKIMGLNSARTVVVTDVNVKNGQNKPTLRMLSTGLLSLNKKKQFQPKKAVTYAEFSKALAYGLGFKLTWSNRPVDFLYYLDRKGVLDIDTDLDAEVSREAAAVAVDKFLQLKEKYDTLTGVVASVNATSMTIKSASGVETYKFSPTASLFSNGQAAETEALGLGTAVNVIFNSKGHIAYVAGTGVDLVEGKLGYGEGQVKVGDTTKFNVNLDMVVASLPNSPNADFTFTQFGNYAQKGVTFMGSVITNAATDEATVITPYISKIENKNFTFNIDGEVVVDFSGDALANQAFKLAEGVKVSLVDGTTTKEVPLVDVKNLQVAGKVLTATALEADATGVVTALTVKAADKK